MNVVVVGAGLSGLSAADLLVRSGVQVHVLEARDRPGGRAMSVPLRAGSTGHLDLGATWGWPHQGRLRSLARELDVSLVEQYVEGDLAFDQAPVASRHAYPSPMTGTFRFEGGVMALTDGLAKRLPAGSIAFRTVVTAIEANEATVQVSGVQAGRPVTFSADTVIIAVPPRVAERTISFTPALPGATAQLLSRTPTWMGAAMKVGVVYPEPFWRAKGLSGFGVSHVGPLQEVHDATPSPPGAAALFGFVGFGRLTATDDRDDRREAVLGQLVRMFGREAAHPAGYFELDWSRESFTSAPLDRQPLAAHPAYGHPLFLEPTLLGRVHWAGAETAAIDGGLLEGAIHAGERAAQRILAQRG